MQARVGILTEADVNGPMPTGGGPGLLDFSMGSTWALVFFLIAVVILFIA